ncbi:MAG TPA: cytochrome c oxidase assembly protein [Alphaproteobacteria bacterium]|nr:cytochrome c oxidase assembly protein [Alphaproteobacteria bacterium]
MQPLTLIAAIALALLPHPAFAHDVAGSGSTWEPGIVVPIAVALLLYGAGSWALLRRRGFNAVAGARAAAFVLALASIAVAFLSPLDSLADDLFSAHMAQHLVLILVAPPLLVLCRPTAVLLWGLPVRVRRGLLRSWRRGSLGLITAAARNPIGAWIAFVTAFVFWHLPGPYRWAVESPAVHALEHLTFVATSLAYWATVLEAEPRRLSYGATLVFVVTAAVLSGLPGALMLLAPRAIYAVHATGAARWGLTPLEDQQLAGVLMWVPMGFVYVGVAAWVFWRWLDEAERRARRRDVARRRAFATTAMVLALVVLTGCDDSKSPARPVPGGDAKRGESLVARVGCGGCHVVPGLADARGVVGPPLTGFGARLYVAGMVPNTPENLIAWIKDPQAIVPGNVMPALGLDDQQARDIAAYLYTLR